MKKILLIHTGGTFGMVPVEPHQTYAPGDIHEQILTYIPQLRQLAELDVMIPFNVDSSNIGIFHWEQLCSLIISQMENFDGFVIIHGTDTMVYTASALSFSLRNLRKPIVLTGAQRPLARLRSDARSNLIDAVELATMDIPEVLIVFGQKILRGNCAKKISATRYDAFGSPNCPLLGEIGVNVEINTAIIHKPLNRFKHLPGFVPLVAMFPVYPAMDPGDMAYLIDSENKVIVLLAFGAGNLPDADPNWIPYIHKSIAAGKAVFIGSQSGHGATDLELYEGGRKALEAGAGQLGRMTSEAAYVKLQKILTLTSNVDEVKRSFSESWAGEL